MKGKIVYISGAISSDPNFKIKFDAAEKLCLERGARIVLNPTILPPGWEYQDYMEHCLLMVRRAEVLFMLPDWQKSFGAKAELAYAESLRKEILHA